MTVNQRAAYRDRESLFAALEMFVNAGDRLLDLQRFRSQHHNFFPTIFYENSEKQASAGRDSYFNWYKRTLRTVWEGADFRNHRLEVLLGLRGVPNGYFERRSAHSASQLPADLLKAEAEYQEIFTRDVIEFGRDATDFTKAGAHISGDTSPDWRTGEIEYHCKVDFGYAVYGLMRESWRARVCPNCRRYLIAAKPANFYCSVDCSGAAKRKRDRDLWKSRGSKKRAARKKSKRYKI